MPKRRGPKLLASTLHCGKTLSILTDVPFRKGQKPKSFHHLSSLPPRDDAPETFRVQIADGGFRKRLSLHQLCSHWIDGENSRKHPTPYPAALIKPPQQSERHSHPSVLHSSHSRVKKLLMEKKILVRANGLWWAAPFLGVIRMPSGKKIPLGTSGRQGSLGQTFCDRTSLGGTKKHTGFIWK